METEVSKLPCLECYDAEVVGFDSETQTWTLRIIRKDEQPEERIFERAILDAAGVTGIGDKVKIQISHSVLIENVVEVRMIIWMSEKASTDFDPKKYIRERINLAEVERILG